MVFLNHPPTYVRTFSLHKVRENCHFLDHPPTPMSLRNKKLPLILCRVDKNTAPHMPRFVKKNQGETVNSCYGIWFGFQPILSCPKSVQKHWKRLFNFQGLGEQNSFLEKAPSGLPAVSLRAPIGLPAGSKQAPNNKRCGKI